MTIPYKPYKKKAMVLTVSIFKGQKKYYAKIYHPNKNVVDTNHTFF